MIISKEEIALYLLAYSNTLITSSVEKDMTFTEAFYKSYKDGLIPLKLTKQTYIDMITIYCYYCNIKILTFFKDYFYKGLDEKKLYYHLLNNSNELNKNCLDNFTKKDIILYIRNALSHNDKENPLYWFERDEKNQIKIHIFLKQTKASLGKNKGKTIPFELIIDLATLFEITQEMAFNSKNYHFFGITFGRKSIEANKRCSSKNPSNTIRNSINGAYYYRNFYKQLNEEETNKIDSVLPNEEYMDKVKEILKPKLLTTKTKKLSQIQKNTLYQNLLECITNKKDISIDIDALIEYECGKVIPLGIAKVESIFISMLRALSFADGSSYNEGTKNLLDGICYGKKESPLYLPPNILKADIKNYNERIKLAITDNINEIHTTLSLYIGYILDSIITSDEIVIDNKIINRSKLRNSFIHGRWYVSENNWELFDGNKNEFDYDWHKSIDIFKLKDFVLEQLSNIYKEKYTKKKTPNKN